MDKFLQAFRLNFMFTRVIFLSALVSCLVPKSIFLTTILSSCIMTPFRPSTPNMSKKNRSVRSSISKILHQCVPFFIRAISVSYDKRLFSFLLRNHCFVLNKPPHAVSGKTSYKVDIYVWIIDIIQGFLYLKIAYSLAHFANQIGFLQLFSEFPKLCSSQCPIQMLFSRLYF